MKKTKKWLAARNQFFHRIAGLGFKREAWQEIPKRIRFEILFNKAVVIMYRNNGQFRVMVLDNEEPPDEPCK